MMDLAAAFGPSTTMKDYFIRFINNLDPNGRIGFGVPWPQWDVNKPKAIVFQQSNVFPIVEIADNYRTAAMDYVVNMSLLYPI